MVRPNWSDQYTPELLVRKAGGKLFTYRALDSRVAIVCCVDIRSSCAVDSLQPLIRISQTAAMPAFTLNNAQIAELLALAAEHAKMPAQKALRRASRRAFMWPEEASTLLATGRSLTELTAVGPFIATLIKRWFDDPPEVPEPPELRRQFLTIADAKGTLAKKPAWLASVRGDLQMHTTWSDGDASIEEMAEAAVARGYGYIAITDHTKGLKIAGGINEEQLQQQAEEIAAVNARVGDRALTVLRSAELNINPRGEGDMDARSLRQLDLVLGCFHSSLRTKDDQTPRYLAALRNPDVHILGHPRGRVYNYRLGLTADWPRVFGLAAELDKAVEIDGYPDRQDLNIDLLKLAKKAGCRISLGTDSHGAAQLRFMEYSAAAALIAGIRKDRILNFMSRDELLAWSAEVRDSSRRAA
jgi:histidinol phosphatase-like PHP family hydrolase